jgi:LPS sulfotransferase NodH
MYDLDEGVQPSASSGQLEFPMKTKGREITRFCVITTQRSGSSWFMAMMNSHPQIGVLGEVFLDRVAKPAWYNLEFLQADRFCQFRQSTRSIRPWSTFRYLDMLVEKFSGEYLALGFKLMYRQLRRQPEILPKLMLDRYRILHVVRENYLDVLISHRIAHKRGEAHARKEVEQPKVYLEPSPLVRILERKKKKVRWMRLFLRILPLPVLEVTYRSLCESTEASLNTAASFLSVPSYTGYESDFRKISTLPDWERIENYEEVRQALAGTEFQGLLDID